MAGRRASLVAAATVVLLLGGCSAGSSAPSSAEPVPPATPSGWGDEPSSAPVDDPAAASFRDAVTLAGRTWDGGYDIDEVDLRFVRHTPGCAVRYVDPPVTDEATDEPVHVEGTAFLQVRCRPVTDLLDQTNRYSSPTTTNVTEIVRTGYDGTTSPGSSACAPGSLRRVAHQPRVTRIGSGRLGVQ